RGPSYDTLRKLTRRPVERTFVTQFRNLTYTSLRCKPDLWWNQVLIPCLITGELLPGDPLISQLRPYYQTTVAAGGARPIYETKRETTRLVTDRSYESHGASESKGL
ncbi:hypothetical protein AVEN_148790-2-1, partial [Araneus ventricosus]